MKTKTTNHNKMHKKRYLQRHGATCPFCDSEDIQPLLGPEHLDGKVIQAYECCRKACGKKWTNIYTLSDVKEIK